jgi:ABC-type dipeptide/oligopeptide/nickel transport system ATPase subunit
MNIIGIAGRSGSGKTTVANILERQHGFVVVNLADPIKRAARDFFNFTEEQCWGDLKDVGDTRYGGLTPRRTFQQIGTEIARTIYEDVWVRYLLDAADSVLRGEAGYTPKGGVDWTHARHVPGVAVGDVRYANEVRAIVAAGGRVWRCWRASADENLVTHSSESLADVNELVTGHLENNGTIEELQERVRWLMTSPDAARWGSLPEGT